MSASSSSTAWAIVRAQVLHNFRLIIIHPSMQVHDRHNGHDCDQHADGDRCGKQRESGFFFMRSGGRLVRYQKSIRFPWNGISHFRGGTQAISAPGHAAGAMQRGKSRKVSFGSGHEMTSQ
jgi:hypothetical protein